MTWLSPEWALVRARPKIAAERNVKDGSHASPQLPAPGKSERDATLGCFQLMLDNRVLLRQRIGDLMGRSLGLRRPALSAI